MNPKFRWTSVLLSLGLLMVSACSDTATLPTADQSNQIAKFDGPTGKAVGIAQFGNLVWKDLNGNGLQDVGEPGIQGVSVFRSGSTIPAVTDANGLYQFTGLAFGTYTVTVATPAGLAPSPSLIGSNRAIDSNGSGTTVTLSISSFNDQTIDFGFSPPNGKIGDFVWKDTNGNGVQDSGEPGIPNVSVTLTGGDAPQTVMTDANGGYLFTGLGAGCYTVTAATPTGFAPTLTGAGTPATDSNGSPANVCLPDASTSDLTIDFGYVEDAPAIALTKLTNGTDNNTAPGVSVVVGSTVTWTYNVTNTGNVTLVNVTVTDDKVGAICVIPSLAAGASTSCTKTGTATEGQYMNMGTVVGTPPVGPNVTAQDPDNYNGYIPNIGRIGDFVWNDTNANGVQDSGEPGISGVTVTLNGPGGTQTTSTDANGAYIFNDLTAGCYTVSSATPVGYSPTTTGAGTSATDSNGSPTTICLAQNNSVDLTADFGFIQDQPSISLVKLTNGTDNNTAPGVSVIVGSTVTWTYNVKNTGNVTLTNVTITDDKVGAICTIASLAPGASDSCTKTGTATEGQYTNMGTVTGTPPVGPNVTAQDPDNYNGYIPNIGRIGDFVWKDTNANGVQDSGEPGIGAITVTLNGPGGTQTTSTDANGGYLFTDLTAGCYTVTVATPAGYAPTATGAGTTATDSNGSPTTICLAQNNSVDLTADFGFIQDQPSISLVKLTNGTDNNTAPGITLVAGSTVTWTYNVKNTGNVTLTNVTITDDKVGAICVIPSLAPGATGSCTKTGTAVVGQYTNMGTVTGTPPFGPNVTAQDPDNYNGRVPDNPSISLIKRTNGTDNNTAPGVSVMAGSTVTWTYEVKNTGNVTLTNVTVTDDKVGAICTIASLAPNAVTTCTKTGTAIVGQYTNMGTVVGTPPSGPNVSDQDPDNYYGVSSGGALTTYTQGGWGAKPAGNNPGMLLKNNWTRVFGTNGVTIGGTYTLKFTSSDAVMNFLPAGKTASKLTKSQVDPKSSEAGVFAGQVLALQLSVSFANAGVTNSNLGNMKVKSGPLAGKSVAQVLAYANTALGGGALPAGVTSISVLNDIVDAINNNFDNGTSNGGFLIN